MSSSHAGGDGTAAEQQRMYLEEMPLVDCSCRPPELEPCWSRVMQQQAAKSTKANKRKHTPAARAGHTTVWIPSTPSGDGVGSVLLFGGANRLATTFGDVWRFDCASSEWIEVSTIGAVPPARSGHSCVYDASQHRVVVFGGQRINLEDGQQEFYHDVWALDCTDWRWRRLPDHCDAPSRNGHIAVMLHEAQAAAASAAASSGDSSQQPSSCMLVFGGSDEQGPSNAVYLYDLRRNTWRLVPCSGEMPEARELHAGVKVECGGSEWLLISGGRGFEGILGTCYALRLPAAPQSAQPQQQRLNSRISDWQWCLVGTCPPRASHSLVALLAAKADAAAVPSLASDAAAVASSSSSAAAAPAASPSDASASSASLPLSSADSSNVFMFGGTDGQLFYNDVLSFRFDPASLDPSLSVASPCERCGGPTGWTMLQTFEQSNQPPNASAADQSRRSRAAPAAASSATSPHASLPPTSFAHALCALPCPSPRFAAAQPQPGAEQAQDAATSRVPATFLLFGGMNQEADSDQTHFLTFQPAKNG